MALRHADGAIVGSKFVSLLGETLDADKAVTRLYKELGVV